MWIAKAWHVVLELVSGPMWLAWCTIICRAALPCWSAPGGWQHCGEAQKLCSVSYGLHHTRHETHMLHSLIEPGWLAARPYAKASFPDLIYCCL